MAWIRRYRYFNTIVTSALEGLYRTIKDWLYHSINDLNKVVKAYREALNT